LIDSQQDGLQPNFLARPLRIDQSIRQSKKNNDNSPWHLANPASLNTQRVLIDGDDPLVEQNVLHLRFHGAQVDRHEERGGQYGPDGHLHFALVVTQAEIADDQLQPK